MDLTRPAPPRVNRRFGYEAVTGASGTSASALTTVSPFARFCSGNGIEPRAAAFQAGVKPRGPSPYQQGWDTKMADLDVMLLAHGQCFGSTTTRQAGRTGRAPACLVHRGHWHRHE